MKRILFGDVVTKMVESGRLEEPMALLFKWAYSLLMEGCSHDWVSSTMKLYMESQGYKIELGNKCNGNHEISMHGLHRIGKK